MVNDMSVSLAAAVVGGVHAGALKISLLTIDDKSSAKRAITGTRFGLSPLSRA
jgi:hypothetical protein